MVSMWQSEKACFTPVAQWHRDQYISMLITVAYYMVDVLKEHKCFPFKWKNYKI